MQQFMELRVIRRNTVLQPRRSFTPPKRDAVDCEPRLRAGRRFFASPRRIAPPPTDASPRLRLDGVLFSADGKTLLSCPRDKTGEYVVPEGVEHIADYAFYKCEALLAVTFPEGLRTIGQEAFEGCQALRAVALPDSAPDEVRRRLLGESFRLTPTEKRSSLVRATKPANTSSRRGLKSLARKRFPVAISCERSRCPTDYKVSTGVRLPVAKRCKRLRSPTDCKPSAITRFTNATRCKRLRSAKDCKLSAKRRFPIAKRCKQLRSAKDCKLSANERFTIATRCRRLRFPPDCGRSLGSHSAILAAATGTTKKSTVSRVTARPVPSRKNTLAPTGSAL